MSLCTTGASASCPPGHAGSAAAAASMSEAKCGELVKMVASFDAPLFRQLIRTQLRVAVGTLVASLLFCVALCSAPHVKIVRRWRKLPLFALFLVVSALGVWYMLLGGQRHRVEPNKLVQQTLNGCRASVSLDAAREAYFMRKRLYPCDIVVVIAGVLFMLSPAFFFCSWCATASYRRNYVVPVGEAHEVPPPAPRLMPVRDSFDVRALLQRFRQPRAQVPADALCAICLEEMTANTVSMLACSHCYHEKCLRRWLRTARHGAQCPLCKTIIAN